MKKKLFLLTVILFVATPKSDVIFPLYAADKFVASASLEKIFTTEFNIFPNISMLPWCGTAIYWPFFQNSFGGPAIPALGLETAIEGRFYPFNEDISGLFIGVYGGGAFMFPSYTAIGASTGLKAGYKNIINNNEFYKFAIEPYGSVSTLPIVRSTYYNPGKILYFPGIIITIGVRFVSQWGKIKMLTKV